MAGTVSHDHTIQSLKSTYHGISSPLCTQGDGEFLIHPLCTSLVITRKYIYLLSLVITMLYNTASAPNSAYIPIQ